jgi:hypothetical protein
MNSSTKSGLPPISAAPLSSLGFVDPQDAARDINELLEAVFGPSEPELRSA